MQDIKNNPILSVMLALLSAAVLFMIFQNGNYNRATENQNQQLWTKLDRMTALFMEERNLMRQDIKDIAKAQMCDGQEIVSLKEKISRLAQYHPINGSGMTERHNK